MRQGDVIELLDAGGGGYGDPAARDRRLILQDIRQGFVTAEGALRDYCFPPDTEAIS